MKSLLSQLCTILMLSIITTVNAAEETHHKQIAISPLLLQIDNYSLEEFDSLTYYLNDLIGKSGAVSANHISPFVIAVSFDVLPLVDLGNPSKSTSEVTVKMKFVDLLNDTILLAEKFAVRTNFSEQYPAQKQALQLLKEEPKKFIEFMEKGRTVLVNEKYKACSDWMNTISEVLNTRYQSHAINFYYAFPLKEMACEQSIRPYAEQASFLYFTNQLDGLISEYSYQYGQAGNGKLVEEFLTLLSKNPFSKAKMNELLNDKPYLPEYEKLFQKYAPKMIEVESPDKQTKMAREQLKIDPNFIQETYMELMQFEEWLRASE